MFQSGNILLNFYGTLYKLELFPKDEQPELTHWGLIRVTDHMLWFCTYYKKDDVAWEAGWTDENEEHPEEMAALQEMDDMSMKLKLYKSFLRLYES